MGKESKSKTVFTAKLSSGVQLIAKPSAIAVPPWQMISAQLNSLSLRVVSWWAAPNIYSTKAGEIPGCWVPGLGKPGDVDIALTGSWDGVTIDLLGGNGRNSNHAKIGLSKDVTNPVCIFGDENQQGALKTGYAYAGQACNSSQNGRGGTFYVVNNAALFKSLTQLFAGRTAGTDQASTDLSGIEKTASKPSAAKAKPAAKKKASAKPKPAAKKKAAAKSEAPVKKKAKEAVKAKPKKVAVKKAVTKKIKSKAAGKAKKAAKKKG
jgi:hypothetical protein